MRLVPDIHIQQQTIWLTREITFNSLDRLIPFRSETQTELLNELKRLTPSNQSIITTHGYEVVRYQFRNALQELKLPPLKSYRYLYAQQLQRQLSPTLGHYRLSLLIMDEMGLKSRTTLWSYLRE